MSLSPFIVFCRGLQCCCKRFDSRTAACFCIEFYDNRATAEAARDDLRCTGRLAPKNVLIAKRPNDTTVTLRRSSAACTVAGIGMNVRKKAKSGALSQLAKDLNVMTNSRSSRATIADRIASPAGAEARAHRATQAAAERSGVAGRFVLRPAAQESDYRHRRLLGASANRPRGRTA
jgi:hypothetical protein